MEIKDKLNKIKDKLDKAKDNINKKYTKKKLNIKMIK